MSALGQKQTLGRSNGMSALPPKADIVQDGRDVRFVPLADIAISSVVPVNSSILRRQGLDPEVLPNRFHLSPPA